MRARLLRRARWTTIIPVTSAAVVVLGLIVHLPTALIVCSVPLLVGAVLSAVEHADAIGHRTGEPFGSLVLAVAVTVIEVGLIVALMSSGGDAASTLARDTVFAAIIICCNGMVGLSIIAGSPRRGSVSLNAEGARAGLAIIAMLTTLCLVLPSYTESRPGPVFTPFQLAFAAVASISLWGVFVLTQTVLHREFFLEDDDGAAPVAEVSGEPSAHAEASIGTSVLLLMIALVGVVGLAKLEAPLLEQGVENIGLPHAVVGVIIAMVVLMPEAITAVRAARRGQLQTSFNLAYGSAIASVGLTIPVLAALSPLLPTGLELGLAPRHVALLVLTMTVSILTILPGRASRLQGFVHLILLGAFVALSINP